MILACHGDQALALLGDPTALEARLLREFRYQPNVATLHTDPSFMPRTRRCWAAWNYRLDAGPEGLEGGIPGEGGHFRVNGSDVSEARKITLQPNDVVVLETPGGGGYGASGT